MVMEAANNQKSRCELPEGSLGLCEQFILAKLLLAACLCLHRPCVIMPWCLTLQHIYIWYCSDLCFFFMSVLSFYAFFPSFSPRNGPRASISQSPCSQAHSAEFINSEYGKYANPTSYSQSAASPTRRTASAQPAATATPSAATTLWKSDHTTICSAHYGNFCFFFFNFQPPFKG